LEFFDQQDNECSDDRLSLLTPREQETFFLFLDGHTMKETACLMGVSISTINTYSNSIYRKLKVNSRAQLIIRHRDLLETHEAESL